MTSQPSADALVQAIAQLRHAYRQLCECAVKDQTAFAHGLIGPQIERLELFLTEHQRLVEQRDEAQAKLDGAEETLKGLLAGEQVSNWPCMACGFGHSAAIDKGYETELINRAEAAEATVASLSEQVERLEQQNIEAEEQWNEAFRLQAEQGQQMREALKEAAEHLGDLSRPLDVRVDDAYCVTTTAIAKSEGK